MPAILKAGYGFSVGKETIIGMLRAWISQRPGLEYGNYGEPTSYRAEVRRIGRDLSDARQFLRQVELSGIDALALMDAFRAYSGRLTLTMRYRVNGKGKTFPTLELAQARANEFLPAIVAIEPVWALDYCTGQYWPTEYRAAACAVLAGALWTYKRECMPDPRYQVGDDPKRSYSSLEEAKAQCEALFAADGIVASIVERYQGKSAGDWIRSSFRREFGRRMQLAYFN